MKKHWNKQSDKHSDEQTYKHVCKNIYEHLYEEWNKYLDTQLTSRCRFRWNFL